MSYYDRMSREGAYSPTARAAIMGTAGSEMGNVAQQQTADIRGRLSANGMGNSIAGVRALSEPGMMRMRSLGDISNRLTAENEMSKTEGMRSLAELQGNYAQARRDDRTNRWNQVVSGIADAAETGYNAFQNKDMPLKTASGKYAVQFPESFSAMSEPEAYEWAANLGHDWNEIRPIWEQMRDDAIMQQVSGGAGGYMYNPILPTYGSPTTGMRSFKTAFGR